MFRRPRILAVLAATLTGWLLAASAASAKAPGVSGGGGMFAILGLPSVGDILNKIVKGVFGALANALLPDFIKDAPDKLVTWLATLPNPTESGTAVYALMQTTRATGIVLLGLVLTEGVIRGMVPGDRDHPMHVLSRVVGVAFFLALYEWLFSNVVALFNTLTVGLLHNDVVQKGMQATVERTFSADAIGNPLSALLVLFALLMLIGLLLVKLMLLYLLPLVFVAWPLLAPLSVPRETAHIPKAMGVLFGALCAIPAGWALLFGVAGAVASDMDAGRVSGAGFLDAGMLAPLTTIGVFALAVWWPFAVLSMAKTLPGQFGLTAGPGPVQRAGGIAGTAAKLRLASMVAAGGMGALAGAKLGSSGPRLASDTPRSTWSNGRSKPYSDDPTSSGKRSSAGASDQAAAGADTASAPPSGGQAPPDHAQGSTARPTAAGDAPPAGGSTGRDRDAATTAGADGDPLRPGAAAAAAATSNVPGVVPTGGPTPGQRNREAVGEGTSPRSTHPTVAAGTTRAAADGRREAPSGPSDAPRPNLRPSAPVRPTGPADAAPARVQRASASPGLPGDPGAPSLDPPAVAPTSAPQRAREAADVLAPASAERAQSVGGLPPASQETAHEAFGKEQS